MSNTRSMKKVLLVLSVVMLVSSVVFASGTNEKVTWKLSHTTAPESPYHIGAVKFAELVSEKTNGNFTIEVHHSGVLGWEREVLLTFGLTERKINPKG